MTSEEAWAAVFNIRLFSEVGPIDDIITAVRTAMLTSHVDACTRGHSPELTTDSRHYQGCGNGWYCKRATEIRNLED